jgi:hypothetical protein
MPGAQVQLSDIGFGCLVALGYRGALVIGPSGQPGEALLFENARNAHGAEFVALVVQ